MGEKILTQVYSSPVGDLLLGSYKGELCIADWYHRKMRASIDARIKAFLEADFKQKEDELLTSARNQLEEYFAGERKVFDLALKFCGSDFQKRVWQQLLKVPFGKTETYLGLSRKLGDDKAVRAVAAANGANALSIIVPCHRVVGSDGGLTGYAGGLSTKRKLLQMEGAQLPGLQPRLF